MKRMYCKTCGKYLGRINGHTKYCYICRKNKKREKYLREYYTEKYYRKLRLKFLDDQEREKERYIEQQKKHRPPTKKLECAKIILKYYKDNGWKIITRKRNKKLTSLTMGQRSYGLGWLHTNGYIVTNTSSTWMIKHDEIDPIKKYGKTVLEYCLNHNWKTITIRKNQRIKQDLSMTRRDLSIATTWLHQNGFIRRGSKKTWVIKSKL